MVIHIQRPQLVTNSISIGHTLPWLFSSRNTCASEFCTPLRCLRALKRAWPSTQLVHWAARTADDSGKVPAPVWLQALCMDTPWIRSLPEQALRCLCIISLLVDFVVVKRCATRAASLFHCLSCPNHTKCMCPETSCFVCKVRGAQYITITRSENHRADYSFQPSGVTESVSQTFHDTTDGPIRKGSQDVCG